MYQRIILIIIFLFDLSNALLICQTIPSGTIFDDFKYSSLDYPIDSNIIGSLYGNNPWLTDTGYISAKAWVRWNIDHHVFNPKSKIEITNDGIKFVIEKGCLPEDNIATIHSTFDFKYGTTASRIKMSKLINKTRQTQAFFLISPDSYNFVKNTEKIQYREEMDFEWNNWWQGGGIPGMGTGYNGRDYKFPIHRFLEFKACGSSPDENVCPESYLSDDIIGGQWATFVFVCDSVNRTFSYSIRINNYNGKKIQVLGGVFKQPENSFSPYIVSGVSLYYTLLVYYGVYLFMDEATTESEMEVDWFLFSERTDLDFDSVESIVDNLRKSNISKLQTSYNNFHTDFRAKIKGEVYLEGPDLVESCKEYQWILKNHNYRWGHYLFDYKYRFHNKYSGWEDWRNSYSIEQMIRPENFHDSIEFFITLSTFWDNYLDTIKKIVPVKMGHCTNSGDMVLYDPYPNPCLSQFSVSFSLFMDMSVTLDLIDEAGRKVKEIKSGYFKSGSYSYEIKTDDLQAGFYFCALKSGDNTISKKIAVVYKDVK